MKQNAAVATLLVIGNAADDHELLASDLAKAGILAVFSRDGTDALRHINNVRPAAILLDAALPDEEDFETCKRLKSTVEAREVPVILALPPESAGQAIASFAAGAADYIIKPLRREELLARIGTHVRLHDLQRRLDENSIHDDGNDKLRTQVAVLEQRLNEILHGISDSLCVLELDHEGRFRLMEANAGAAHLMHLEREAIIGKSVEEVMPHAAERGLLCGLRRCLDTAAVIDEHLVLDAPSGRIDLHTIHFPIHDNGTAQARRVVSLVRNVTLRRRQSATRQDRNELESLLRKIVEVSPGSLGVYRLGPDGRASMPYASPRLEEVTGFDRNKVRLDASYAISLVHPDDRIAHLASIMESARTMEPWRNEFRVRHPVKGEIWLEGRSIPERAPDGAILWYGFMLDITERKRAEQSLLASEKKFRALADNLPDIIIRYDRSCRRVYVNSVFWERICPDGEEALGTLPGAYWRGSIPVQAYLALIEQVMETGNPVESFMSWREDDGSLTHYIFHIVAEYDTDGGVVGALAIGRDITALKEAELRLAESRQHLRELAAHRDTAREEERKHIARELHDELGQFLSALRMQTSMLRIQFAKDNPALAAHVNSMIEMIDSNIQVVRNISSALRPVVLDLGILAGLEWLVDEFVRYSGVPCTLDMMKEKLDMDNHFATTLFRVAQESLTNVARHADASEVRVSLQRTDSHYHLRIVDDGNGFVPEYISKKTLGLIGMRERVLMLGGQIRIISAPGEGTTVKVDIPISGV